MSKNKLGSNDFAFLPLLNFPNLEKLNLEENHLSNAGTEFLSKSNFPKLKILNLNHTKVNLEKLALLKFKTLEKLYLNNNKLEKAIDFLVKGCFDNLEVHKDSEGTLINDKLLKGLTKEILETDYLPNLKCLYLSGNHLHLYYKPLLKSKLFPKLTKLDMSNNELMINFVEDLIKIDNKLTGLDLSRNSFQSSVIEVLVKMNNFHSLRNLYLTGCSLTDNDMNIICFMKSLKIQKFKISFNEDIGSEGFRCLLKSKWIHNLKYLDIGSIGINDEVVNEYFESPGIKNTLEKLDIFSNNLSTSLNGILGLNNLKKVVACNNKDEVIAEKIINMDNLDKKVLYLWSCQVTPQVCKTIFDSPNMARVIELYLNDNFLGDEGAEVICTCDYISNLSLLNLFHNEIRPNGFTYFALTKCLPNLQELNISENYPDEDSINALVYNTNLTNLSILDLSTSEVSFINEFKDKVNSKHDWKFKIIFSN